MMVKEQAQQNMRFIEVLLIAGAVFLFLIPPAWANSAPPLTTMTVYFERDGIPVNETVKFTVNCSAFDNLRENQPNEINKFGDLFSYSAICPSYGCFDHLYHYMPYGNLTSCDFTGELNGEQFTILDAQHPFSCAVSSDWRKQPCEVHVDLSSAKFFAIQPQAADSTSVPGNVPVVMETPQIKSGESLSIFDDFICFFKIILGGTC